MDILLGLVSFLTGVTVIIQSAVNGRLRSMTANPIFASAASFGGGLLLLFLMLFAAHWLGIYTIPALSALGQTRPWMYIGGLIGTALVIGSIVIPKKNRLYSLFQYAGCRPAGGVSHRRCHRLSGKSRTSAGTGQNLRRHLPHCRGRSGPKEMTCRTMTSFQTESTDIPEECRNHHL